MAEDNQEKLNIEAREEAEKERKPKIKPVIEAADSLSLVSEIKYTYRNQYKLLIDKEKYGFY